MTTIAEFAASFTEEPGYFDFARLGPIGASVVAEETALLTLVSSARFGALATLDDQSARARDAVADLIGYRSDQVAFEPHPGLALSEVVAALPGSISLSSTEGPTLTHAVQRAHRATDAPATLWLDTDHGRVTPGNLRKQLTPAIVAVAVSLVDVRTGFLVDIEGIRQVIGDRVLIVDAQNAFGIVDAPWELADVLVSSGHTFARAGWGTGFLAMSDRALDRLGTVWADAASPDTGSLSLDGSVVAASGIAAFTTGADHPLAAARFASALEHLAEVGVAEVQSTVADKVSHIIDTADEFVIPVASSRDESERAGIVVIEPPAAQLTMLSASLFNHGVTATTRGRRVRLSAHVSTTEESIEMLRAAFTSFGSAITL